ncbi:MAG: SDR family NAD(P)-dependent oxidoreductase [Dehalococcoidales bacterium]|nr:SDR family NAD(P)-dependent oxidoreductase [Dehalococcoidales bacterium]
MNILDSFSLKNRVALVTGGRRGIGKAIVLALAQAGADIALCDNMDENGEFEKLTADLKEIGRRCLTIKTDVARSEQVQEMVKKTLLVYGKIDILVNNAGISPGTPPIPELKEADWDAVIDINLKGTYLCIREVSQSMIARKSGSIINISSVEGLGTVRKSSSPYGASKSGIVMLTRGLAWDLGKYNIRVNAIAPGAIKTEMTRGMWDAESESFKNMLAGMKAVQGAAAPKDAATVSRQYWARIVPLERMAEPSDIASGALYLASDAAAYVTGHTLVIDGGMLA